VIIGTSKEHTMDNATTSYDWNSWTQQVEFNGETLHADQLQRAEYATFLTHYLNSTGQREGGYVMNLNAEWGAGKTWFLKRWCQTLKPHHPVAYIDAWKNDFSDDPLLTVVSGVLEALKQNPHVRWIEREQKLFSKLGQFAKLGVGVTDAVLKANGINGLGEAFGVLLSSHQKKSEGIDALRTEIRNWLQDVTESHHNRMIYKPMYVFIDELDRCRPTYAIELLETVKHLFEIKGIVFVIATNTDQLQHSIKAVYGQGFDANRYLYRFFQRTYTLKIPDMEKFVLSYPAFTSLGENLASTANGNIQITQDHLAVFLAGMSESFGFDLRTTGQWLDQLDAIFSDVKNRNTYFWGMIALMAAMKLSDSSLFYEHLFIHRREASPSEHSKKIDRSFMRRVVQEHRPGGRNLVLSINVDHLPQSVERPRATGFGNGIPSHITGMQQSTEKLKFSWVDDLKNSRIDQSAIPENLYDPFWKDDNNGDLGGFNIAVNYCSLKLGATINGYISLIEQAACIE
jgi:hypothetical protein